MQPAEQLETIYLQKQAIDPTLLGGDDDVTTMATLSETTDRGRRPRNAPATPSPATMPPSYTPVDV